MRKPEQETWHLKLKPVLDQHPAKIIYARHEDKVSLGVPDLSYAAHGSGGWVELKRIRAPLRPGSRLKVRHLTEQQKGFLALRGRFGQGAFVLVHVDEKDGTSAFYLWGHWQLDLLTDGLRYSDWRTRALGVWTGRPDGPELLVLLSGHQRGTIVG
jgi:hypothetical protein